MKYDITLPQPSWWSGIFRRINHESLDEHITSKLAALGYEKIASRLFIEQCLIILALNEGKLSFEEDLVDCAWKHWENAVRRIERKLTPPGIRLFSDDIDQIKKINAEFSNGSVSTFSVEQLGRFLHLEVTLAEYAITDFPPEKPSQSAEVLYGGPPEPYFRSFAPMDLDLGLDT